MVNERWERGCGLEASYPISFSFFVDTPRIAPSAFSLSSPHPRFFLSPESSYLRVLHCCRSTFLVSALNGISTQPYDRFVHSLVSVVRTFPLVRLNDTAPFAPRKAVGRRTRARDARGCSRRIPRYNVRGTRLANGHIFPRDPRDRVTCIIRSSGSRTNKVDSLVGRVESTEAGMETRRVVVASGASRDFMLIEVVAERPGCSWRLAFPPVAIPIGSPARALRAPASFGFHLRGFSIPGCQVSKQLVERLLIKVQGHSSLKFMTFNEWIGFPLLLGTYSSLRTSSRYSFNPRYQKHRSPSEPFIAERRASVENTDALHETGRPSIHLDGSPGPASPRGSYKISP